MFSPDVYYVIMQQVQCRELMKWKPYKQTKNIKARFQDLDECDESFYVTYMYKKGRDIFENTSLSRQLFGA